MNTITAKQLEEILARSGRFPTYAKINGVWNWRLGEWLPKKGSWKLVNLTQNEFNEIRRACKADVGEVSVADWVSYQSGNNQIVFYKPSITNKETCRNIFWFLASLWGEDNYYNAYMICRDIVCERLDELAKHADDIEDDVISEFEIDFNIVRYFSVEDNYQTLRDNFKNVNWLEKHLPTMLCLDEEIADRVKQHSKITIG